jgi:hypothetical protein
MIEVIRSNDRQTQSGWVLQMVLEPTLMVSQRYTSQLRRIRQCTGQERGYICMTRGSFESIWCTDVAKR